MAGLGCLLEDRDQHVSTLMHCAVRSVGRPRQVCSLQQDLLNVHDLHVGESFLDAASFRKAVSRFGFAKPVQYGYRRRKTIDSRIAIGLGNSSHHH